LRHARDLEAPGCSQSLRGPRVKVGAALFRSRLGRAGIRDDRLASRPRADDATTQKCPLVWHFAAARCRVRAPYPLAHEPRSPSGSPGRRGAAPSYFCMKTLEMVTYAPAQTPAGASRLSGDARGPPRSRYARGRGCYRPPGGHTFETTRHGHAAPSVNRPDAPRAPAGTRTAPGLRLGADQAGRMLVAKRCELARLTLGHGAIWLQCSSGLPLDVYVSHTRAPRWSARLVRWFEVARVAFPPACPADASADYPSTGVALAGEAGPRVSRCTRRAAG
jgi:hypothetical protein